MWARYTALEFKNKRLLLHCTGNRVTVMTQVQMPWDSFFIVFHYDFRSASTTTVHEWQKVSSATTIT
jgi:hypothetical protein